MKILLVGEFSGLHSHLKQGLVELGYDARIWANGDGWKNISCDYKYYKRPHGNKIVKLFDLLSSIRDFEELDVVQFISPVQFPTIMRLNKFIYKSLMNSTHKTFLVGAGQVNNELILANYLRKAYKYKDFVDSIDNSDKFWCEGRSGRQYNSWLFEKINGYIPIMYEYAQPYREINHPKLRETIPLPFNIDSVEYSDNVVKDKVVFFHGINREGEKGTPLIIPAMERLKENYPNDVEIVVDGKMPIDTYLKFLETVNVVIDQAYSTSYGMNALYAMAKGRIVVGGGEEECLKEFGFDETPIVPIYPRVDDIYEKLVSILKRKSEILEWGRKSRKFVGENHDSVKIASRYLEVWKNS